MVKRRILRIRFKPQPALFQGRPPIDARFPRGCRDRLLSERDRQQETADHDDRRRPQQGGQEGQADVDDRRSLDQRHGDEEHRRQMDKIGGQAVEQVGQDQLFPADLLLVVGLGQQGVGRYPGEHRQRKGGAGDIGKVAEPYQGPGQQGDLSRPVQGLDEIGDKQAERQHADQPEQGPEQPVPEQQEGISRDGHRMQPALRRLADAADGCVRIGTGPGKSWSSLQAAGKEAVGIDAARIGKKGKAGNRQAELAKEMSRQKRQVNPRRKSPFRGNPLDQLFPHRQWFLDITGAKSADIPARFAAAATASPRLPSLSTRPIRWAARPSKTLPSAMPASFSDRSSGPWRQCRETVDSRNRPRAGSILDQRTQGWARLSPEAIGVVPMPSLWMPRPARVSSKVGITPNMPIEPVRVVGAAQISSASAAIQ